MNKNYVECIKKNDGSIASILVEVITDNAFTIRITDILTGKIWNTFVFDSMEDAITEDGPTNKFDKVFYNGSTNNCKDIEDYYNTICNIMISYIKNINKGVYTMDKGFVASNGCVVKVVGDELFVYDKRGEYCYSCELDYEDICNNVNNRYFLYWAMSDIMENGKMDNDDMLDMIDGLELAQVALDEWLEEYEDIDKRFWLDADEVIAI